MAHCVRVVFLILLIWFLSSQVIHGQQMVDKNASKETRALYESLKTLSSSVILFGHQDDLAYGVTWNNWYKCRSDVHDVCGKYPAVFGWEVGALGTRAWNIDSVNFERMQEWMKRVYRMDGVNTVSWHMGNYATGGSAWDTAGRVVPELLPGGSKHDAFKKSLDDFATFVSGLKTGFPARKEVPLVFRPFHEHTGSWFWWGQPHCTPDQYKALWRFTVEYLRDVKGLHNLIYAYSPDIFRDKEHYLECYPGDEWVDILGLDNYHDVGSSGKSEDLIRRLRMVVELADERGKFAALTETGREAIPEADWWMERLLNPIKSDPVASRIAWILVWRNAKPTHHYAPYPGHLSAPNFIEFSNDKIMCFQSDLPPMYRGKVKSK